MLLLWVFLATKTEMSLWVFLVWFMFVFYLLYITDRQVKWGAWKGMTCSKWPQINSMFSSLILFGLSKVHCLTASCILWYTVEEWYIIIFFKICSKWWSSNHSLYVLYLTPVFFLNLWMAGPSMWTVLLANPHWPAAMSMAPPPCLCSPWL